MHASSNGVSREFLTPSVADRKDFACRMIFVVSDITFIPDGEIESSIQGRDFDHLIIVS